MKTKTKVAIAVAAGLVYMLAVRNATADTYIQQLGCAATGIALNNPSTSATVTCPNTPPPPPGGACTQGFPSDVVIGGVKSTAQCGGNFLLHSGGPDTVKGTWSPPTPYTFKFVFGNNVNEWPGGPFGTTSIFGNAHTQGRLSKNQYLSIPFVATPGHTIQFANNGTYTTQPITFSVSTIPGVFNASSVGFVCSNDRGNIVLSSNGSTTAQCKLNTSQEYWVNVIPAKNGTSGWYTGCTSAACAIGVTIYQTN